MIDRDDTSIRRCHLQRRREKIRRRLTTGGRETTLESVHEAATLKDRHQKTTKTRNIRVRPKFLKIKTVSAEDQDLEALILRTAATVVPGVMMLRISEIDVPDLEVMM